MGQNKRLTKVSKNSIRSKRILAALLSMDGDKTYLKPTLMSNPH
jgi:hypothetical protein